MFWLTLRTFLNLDYFYEILVWEVFQSHSALLIQKVFTKYLLHVSHCLDASDTLMNKTGFCPNRVYIPADGQ